MKKIFSIIVLQIGFLFVVYGQSKTQNVQFKNLTFVVTSVTENHKKDLNYDFSKNGIALVFKEEFGQSFLYEIKLNDNSKSKGLIENYSHEIVPKTKDSPSGAMSAFLCKTYNSYLEDYETFKVVFLTFNHPESMSFVCIINGILNDTNIIYEGYTLK